MLDFRAIFESSPEPYLVLRADPGFTIEAVNDAYLDATLTRREEIVGRPVFDVFPDNPADPKCASVKTLRASLEAVVATRAQQQLPATKYDIPRGNEFEERFWLVCNVPVLGPDGAVSLIIHRVQDVTALVRLQDTAQEQHVMNETLRAKADAAAQASVQRTDELARTSRQLAESRKLLDDANARLEAAVTAGAVGTWIWEIPSDRLFGDENLARWFAVPPNRTDASLADYLAAVHPHDLPRLRATIDDSVSSGANAECEYRVRRQGGTWRYILARWKTQLNGAAKPVRLVGVVLDISDLHQATESATQLREQYDLAAKAAEIGTFSLRLPSGELAWNDCYAEHLWIPPETPPSMELFYSRVHPEDREMVRAAVKAAIEARDPYDVEFRSIAPDGAIRWIHAKGRANENKAGAPTRFDGISIDVTPLRVVETKLRQSEALYRAVIDSLPDYAIFLLNDEGIVTHWNAGAQRLLGFAGSEILGKPGRIIFTPEDQARGEPEKEIETAKNSGRASDDRWHMRSDGTRFFASGLMTSIIDARGQRIALAKIMRDITERHTAAAEREVLLQRERAARAEAERTSRLKDEFLATLSHELRTPLNAILGWTQVLKESGSDPAEVAEGLEIIDRNTRIQAQLIEDLLDMSRIVSGKVRLVVAPVDLATIVQAAADSVRTAANAKQIRLSIDIAPGSTAVMGDRTRLQQVAWNLLSNAIKFTPNGGQVKVAVESADNHLRLRVSDNGSGISPEFLPHVFERFRQADASTTRLHGGLGLGLSIVKQLVELHGGIVRAESGGLGQGATFIAEIPRLPPINPAEPPHPEAKGASRVRPKATVDLSGLRVLVVEDEPDSAHLVERVLRGSSAEVLAVRSVPEALASFPRLQPHVVLSDIGMPQQDGYELIRRLRDLPGGADVPAAALTALARGEDVQRAIEAGFRTHLSKPVEPAELVAVVARLAGRPEPELSKTPAT
jgi:PAS domain S-box-containing protein